jgi:Protein of unknown function (DUF1570)
MRSRAALLCVFAIFSLAASPAQLKVYQGRFYEIHTDLTGDDLREAELRMTRMAEVYRDRTKDFSGTVGHKFPFFLYKNPDDYYAAGGQEGSAGYFDPNNDTLMAMVAPDQAGQPGGYTWHTIQHEGFHQFARAVIGGELPIWVNEGLAEYFGEGVFTGDGMVTGVIPQDRLDRVRDLINSKRFKSMKDMMLLPHSEWNKKLKMENYDQAWSMVQFLAHGENGKYQRAFGGFMRSLSTGHQWQQAWQANFGTAVGFEDAWKKYWLALPDRPTADLYAKAVIETVTGTLARATAQKMKFADFDALAGAVDRKEFKPDAKDWVPPSLLKEMFDAAGAMRTKGGAQIDFVPGAGSRPAMVVCTMKSGAKLTGRYALRDGKVAEVVVDLSKH